MSEYYCIGNVYDLYKDGEHIAIVSGLENAQAFAAAPELLEVVKAIRQWDMLDGCSDGAYWKEKLDKAIKKARGES